MSMELLYELDNELQRLMIAGSNLASGDFRLKRLVAPLQQAGKQLPVFDRISNLVEQALNSQPEKSAECMLELINLLYAVLYTQGETGSPGELTPFATTPVPGFTETFVTYRRLKLVIEALTSKGSGRLEIIEQARQDGLFADPRLLYPALQALDDSYSEISDLVFQILFLKGPSIIPLLRATYQPGGAKRDARKLELMAAILGAGGKEYYLEAIDKGSVAVKVAAIKALKVVPEAEPLLKELTKDRKKEIREAAEESLKLMHPVAEMLKGITGAVGKILNRN